MTGPLSEGGNRRAADAHAHYRTQHKRARPMTALILVFGCSRPVALSAHLPKIVDAQAPKLDIASGEGLRDRVLDPLRGSTLGWSRQQLNLAYLLDIAPNATKAQLARLVLASLAFYALPQVCRMRPCHAVATMVSRSESRGSNPIRSCAREA
jgi:hypothetical protein